MDIVLVLAFVIVTVAGSAFVVLAVSAVFVVVRDAFTYLRRGDQKNVGTGARTGDT